MVKFRPKNKQCKLHDFFFKKFNLQFNVIKWAKQRPGQNPIDVKSDEAIQI